jgi:hypothetical protein
MNCNNYKTYQVETAPSDGGIDLATPRCTDLSWTNLGGKHYLRIDHSHNANTFHMLVALLDHEGYVQTDGKGNKIQ